MQKEHFYLSILHPHKTDGFKIICDDPKRFDVPQRSFGLRSKTNDARFCLEAVTGTYGKNPHSQQFADEFWDSLFFLQSPQYEFPQISPKRLSSFGRELRLGKRECDPVAFPLE